jgi:hypothetical protein
MFKKNKIALLIFLLLITVGSFFYIKINKPQFKDLKTVETKLNYNANDLVLNFIANEKSLQEQLSGKVIEVEGIVKEVTFLNNRNTVILQTSHKTSGVICDFEPKQINGFNKIVVGSKVKIKGIYKGFLKDVVLLNCYLNSNQPNE